MIILHNLTIKDVVKAITKEKPKIKADELVNEFEQHMFWVRDWMLQICVSEINRKHTFLGLVASLDSSAEAVSKIDFDYAVENYPDSSDAQTVANATAYYLAFLEWHKEYEETWHNALEHFTEKEAVYWIDQLTQPQPIQLDLFNPIQ